MKASRDTGRLLAGEPGHDDGRPVLLAFPYAGGGAQAFTGWATALAPSARLVPVVLPGRERRLRERPYLRMKELLTALVPAVTPLTDRPVVLFGHSMGAVVALALGRELRSRGLPPPAAFIASGAPAPHLRHENELLHALPDDAFLARVMAYGGTPDEVLRHPDLVALLLPTLRADFTLYETWACPPPDPLPVPITLLYGRDDATVSAAQLLGWAAHSVFPVRMTAFDGGHFFIDSARQGVLAEVRRVLDRCRNHLM